MLTYHKATFDDPAHYLDKETKRKWRRIAGGIGWPQEGLSGAALVLAQDLADLPNYEVLAFTQDHNAGTLLDGCKALELEFPVKYWYGDISNRTMMILLHEFNKGKFPENKFKFQMAPLADEIKNNSGFYLPKVIDLGIDGRLNAVAAPVLLEELKNDETWPDTHLNLNIAKFPVLAALCYPLAQFLMYSGEVVKPLKRDYLKQYGANAWLL